MEHWVARRRPGWGLAVGRVWVFALSVGLAAAGCAAPNNPRGRADERIVYCLDPSRQAALVDVATRLAITLPSSQDLQRWRGPDFDRACNALMAANGRQFVAPAPGNPAWLTDLLATLRAAALLLVGGLLTLLTGGMRDAGTRRRLQAAQLRSATENLVSAAGSYLDDKVDAVDATASSQSTSERRQELRAKLRETQALYPRKVDSKPALQLLDDELNRDIQGRWVGQSEEQRRARAKDISAHLTTLTGHTEVINLRLERSWLAWLGGTK